MGAAVPQEFIASNVSSAKLLAEDAPTSPHRSVELGNGNDGFEPTEAPDHGSAGEPEESAEESVEIPEGGDEILREDSVDSEGGAGSMDEKGPVLGGPSPSEASPFWPEDVARETGEKSAASVAPVSKTFHFYYFAKIPRRAEDRSGLAATESQLKDKTDKRDKIVGTLQKKRAERAEIFDEMPDKGAAFKSCKEAVEAKAAEVEEIKKELKSINDEIKNLKDGSGTFRSVKDLEDKIKQLEYTMQHESLSPREEKQLFREIKNLKASREQVAANEAIYLEQSKQRGVVSQRREEVEKSLQVARKEYQELKNRREAAFSVYKPLLDAAGRLRNEMTDLVKQRVAAEEDRNGIYEKRRTLNEQEEFFHNRREIATARQLASTGNRAAVEELCNKQVEQFMEKWNNDPAYRAEYIKNNEQSTLRRLSTLDGRSLGPGETPAVLRSDNNFNEVPKSNKVENEAAAEQPAAPAAPVVEPKPKPVEDVPMTTTTTPKQTVEQDEEAEALEEQRREEEKERRRQEEIEKAREAEVRKKRQAEKKQAKAQLRSEREALRKEKEKQKKQQKKKPAAPSDDESRNASMEESDETTSKENGVHETINDRKPSAAAAPAAKASVGRPTKSSVRAALRRRRPLHRQVSDQILDVLRDWKLLAIAGGVILLVVAVVLGNVYYSRQGAEVSQ